MTDGTSMAFGARLRVTMDTFGAVCVGIDPHPELLTSWGLPVSAAGVRAFAQTCAEAFAGRVAAVKPQSAFFEEYGSAGIAVLEEILPIFQAAGTPVILDVKRGDIGSTMAGYARAYLADQAPLACDAITVSPYLGFGSLAPAMDLAQQTGRGLFVLALTSNPEGRSVQHVGGAGASVAGAIVTGAAEANARAAGRGELGSIGLVVGATVGSAVRDLGIDLAAANAPILAPGFGAQGGTAAEAAAVFGAALPNVLAASSREVLSAGPDVAALRRRAEAARIV
ncbi:orotidine-5'-phosphate decarboxylase [Nostocoides veronense]|uniref:Orotidine-5'-phosphate decarboxylase n=1 Tax=Nostocoides veronense TaxID=330836 RepID=A0ABN2LG30_9MICO